MSEQGIVFKIKIFLENFKKSIDKVASNMYNSSKQQGGEIIENKSRAGYFRKRRENLKQFNVAVEKDKMTEFEKKLKEQNKTKKAWLEEKIDEEIKK